MIEHCTGSIFDARVQALVNPVNCFGVAGKGLALEFRQRFPMNFEEYAAWCRLKNARPGKTLFFFDRDYWIVNFTTKDHWRGTSFIEWIESGMHDMVMGIVEHHIKSIAIPALGCGLGDLRWHDVRPVIEKAMEPLPDVRVLLYGPQA